MDNQTLQGVVVEVPRRQSKDLGSGDSRNNRPKVKRKRDSEFVYVNNAYVGSLNSVTEVSLPTPPTRVIREQYWTCAKWPLAQRILAVSVGILLGAVIGLAVTLVIEKVTNNVDITGLFSSSARD